MFLGVMFVEKKHTIVCTMLRGRNYGGITIKKEFVKTRGSFLYNLKGY